MPELRIPIGRYAQRVFWVVVGGAIGLIALARFVLIPEVFNTPTPSISAILDESLGNIFSTVVAATVLSGVVLWLIAPSKKRADLDVVHPKDIGIGLNRALRKARSWHYDGSTGRWNRSDVLPKLAAAARQTNSTRSCRLIVMDPQNEGVCQAYADYRRGLRTGRANTWNLRSVRADLCTTVVLAAVYESNEPLLDIRLYVKSVSPVYRIDASDKHLMLTREDPAEPALACEADTHFFDAFMETVNFDARQAREVVLWNKAPECIALDRDAVREILATAQFNFPELADDDFVDSVIAEAGASKNPYGS